MILPGGTEIPDDWRKMFAVDNRPQQLTAAERFDRYLLISLFACQPSDDTFPFGMLLRLIFSRRKSALQQQIIDKYHTGLSAFEIHRATDIYLPAVQRVLMNAGINHPR